MAHEARTGRARLSAAGRRRARRRTGPTTRSLAGASFAVPPLALLGVAVFLAFRGGGIVPEQWAPVAVGTAVGLAVLGAVGSLPRVPRPAWPALGALAAFFAWSALSMLWSASPEATLESVARLSLLVLAAAVGASYAARAVAARALAVALAGAGAVLALTVEAKILAGKTGAFSTTRLAWPIDYANGEAAPALDRLSALLAGAAVVERIRPLGRALVAGVASLVLAEGLMTLSRGAPSRLGRDTGFLRRARDRARDWPSRSLGSLCLSRFSPLASPPAAPARSRPTRLAAGRAGARAAAAALIVALIASLEHVWPRTFQAAQGAVAVAVWVSILAFGATAFVVHYGRPDAWLSARWHEFRNPQLAQPGGAALRQCHVEPLRLLARGDARSMRILLPARAQVPSRCRGSAAARSTRASPTPTRGRRPRCGDRSGRLRPPRRADAPPARPAREGAKELGSFAVVALGGTGAYFVLHGSLEWLFLIAAIAVPPFVALGACAAAGEEREIKLAPGRQRTAIAVGALAAAVAAVPVYFSTTLAARAENQAATSTQRALDTLSLATQVNPWAVQPLIVRSAILDSVGDYSGARRWPRTQPSGARTTGRRGSRWLKHVLARAIRR